MIFKGYEALVVPRKKDYANEGYIYAHYDQSHFWGLKDIRSGNIVLKSQMFDTKEEAEEAAKAFMGRLRFDLADD